MAVDELRAGAKRLTLWCTLLIGGLLAGAPTILGIDGWRWIFLINVPIGAVALVVVAKVLNLPHTRRGPRRIDWPGATLLAVGLVPLLLVAEQGRAWGWGSAASVSCYVLGGLGLLFFVLVERWYGDDALLLKKKGEAIDSFGQVGFDPGTAWTSGDVKTVDSTLRRKVGVTAGDPNGTDAFDPAAQWDSLTTDTFDGLGSR